MLTMRKVRPFTVPVLLDMTITSGKGFKEDHDLSNLWKAIEDLLVSHGIIPDDNVKWVKGHCDRYEEGQAGDKARCLLTIQEKETER